MNVISYFVLFNIFIPPTSIYCDKASLNLAIYISTKTETFPPCQGATDRYYFNRLYLPSKFAIQKISKSDEILPNVTLDIALIETCRTDITIIKNTILQVAPYWPQIDSIPPTCANDRQNSSRRVAVIGAIHSGWSRNAIQISNQIQINKIPLLAQSATSPELSNHQKHPYFFRLVPTDDIAALAAVKLLTKLQWTFVALLFVDDSYGGYYSERFITEAAKSGLCIGLIERMNVIPTMADIAETYKKIKRLSKLSVLISALDARLHVNPIIDLMIKDDNADKYVWFMTDSFDMQYIIDIPDNGKNITIRGYQTFFPLFFDYEYEAFIKSLSVNDPMLTKDAFHRDVVSEFYKCDWSLSNRVPCYNKSLMDIINSEYQSPKTRFYSAIAVDTINLYAKTIHKMINNSCPQVFQAKPIPNNCIDPDLFYNALITNDYFSDNGRHIKFKDNGDAVDAVAYVEFEINAQIRQGKYFGIYKNDVVSYDANQTFWARKPRLAPGFVNCVETCLVDEVKITEEVACCSTCRKCRDNEIKNINETKCIACLENFWPDPKTRLLCERLQPQNITTEDPLFLSIALSASIGELLAIMVLFFFAINRDRKLLKATSIPTSIGLLLAIGVVFGQSTFYLLPPTQFICTTKLIFFHITYSIIYGLLLIKLLRIFLIFKAASNFSKATNLGNGSQFLGMTLIVSIQVIIVALLLSIFGLPTPKLVMASPFVPHVELTCNQNTLQLYVPIAYNILIILITAYLGYATRKLPENFKETLNIFVCSISTVFLWISFFPIYNFLTSHMNQVLLFLINLQFSGHFYIISLFLPKIYGVVFLNEEQMKVKVWKSTETKSENKTEK